MTINTYQIRNVLRIYGNQLKRRSELLNNGMETAEGLSDFVDISAEARRKQVLTQLSERLVSQLNPTNRKARSPDKDEVGKVAPLLGEEPEGA